jgi:hypothetical protein
LLLLSNFIDKNTNGLNSLLDDLLSSVFGDAFESAYNRAATMTGNIKLDESTLAAFGIEEIFEGEEVYIGKAELNMLFAAMRFVKASLEWVSAYDWDTDLNFLRNGPLWDDWSKLGSNKPANLPFRNNFLKDRGNGMMAKSKADFSKAIDDSIAAYNLWIGDSSNLPQGYKDTLNEYQWVKDGFDQFKTAINSGGTFYVKEHDAGTASYSNTSANAILGINLGKFFSPGQLAIDKLIENTGSGNSIAPKFYGNSTGNDEGWTEITEKEQISSCNSIGLMIKVAPINEIVVTGVEDREDSVMAIFSPDLAEIVWDWYH